MNHRLWLPLLLGLTAAPAWAQDEGGGGGGGRGVGVMTDANITNVGTNVLAGALYDGGAFRFGGGLGLGAREGGAIAFSFGLQGFFVLHSTKDADFSLGGGLVLGYTDSGPGAGVVRFGIRAGGQARLFVTENAALTGGIGMDVSVGEGGFELGLGGGLTATFGFQYYF